MNVSNISDSDEEYIQNITAFIEENLGQESKLIAAKTLNAQCRRSPY